MRVETPDSDIETYEHIPWSRLTLTNEVGERGRWMYYIAGLLLVAAIAAVVARNLWKPTVAAVVPSTVLVAPTVPTVPISTDGPMIYSEADLMATAPDLGESDGDFPQSVAVVAVAEQYVREWVQETEAGWNYVEWVRVRSIERIDRNTSRVVVLMQVVHGGDSDTVRMPVEAVELIIEAGEEAMSIADLPVPVPTEPIELGSFDAVSEEVPNSIAASALNRLAGFGDPFVIGASRIGDLWRVEMGVTTHHGFERFYAVWVTAEGTITTPAALIETAEGTGS